MPRYITLIIADVEIQTLNHFTTISPSASGWGRNVLRPCSPQEWEARVKAQTWVPFILGWTCSLVPKTKTNEIKVPSILEELYYILRDPLPAKHPEEQTDTKTYDLWCRKGGGTGWQDIKATDLWCRKGGGTGWQDIKATDLWCRKGGGTGWQDIKAIDLWCRKGGGKRWQGISAISGARGAAERDEGWWKLLIFGAWQVAEEGIRRASKLLIWGILRCRTGGRKEQQDIKPTAHEM